MCGGLRRKYCEWTILCGLFHTVNTTGLLNNVWPNRRYISYLSVHINHLINIDGNSQEWSDWILLNLRVAFVNYCQFIAMFTSPTYSITLSWTIEHTSAKLKEEKIFVFLMLHSTYHYIWHKASNYILDIYICICMNTCIYLCVLCFSLILYYTLFYEMSSFMVQYIFTNLICCMKNVSIIIAERKNVYIYVYIYIYIYIYIYTHTHCNFFKTLIKNVVKMRLSLIDIDHYNKK